MGSAIIRMGHECNNRCLFCHNSKSDSGRASIYGKILEAKALGCSMVMLSGGEPTIRKDLLSAARLINSHGMSVGLVTNGRMLRYRELVMRLKQAGLVFAYVSLLGPDWETHDSIANSVSFNDTISGISNLVEAGIRHTVNVTIIRRNMGKLSKIVELLKGLGVTSLKFSYVEIKGRMAENIDELPKMEDAADAAKAAIDLARSYGISAYYDCFPCCLMIGYARDDLSTNRISHISNIEDKGLCETDRSNRARTSKCNKCELSGECDGPEREYVRLFGDIELRPKAKVSNAAAFFRKGEGKLSIEYRGETYSYASSDFSESRIAEMLSKGHVFIPDRTGDVLRLRRLVSRDGILVPSNHETSQQFDEMLEEELSALKGSVLDIGCGDIYFRELFRRKSLAGEIDYAGVDPEPKECGLPVQKGTGESLSLGISYDNILFLGSLNHMMDPKRAILRAYGHLKPGGMMYLTDNEPCIILQERDNGPGKEFEHYSNLSLEDVKGMLPDMEIEKEIPSEKTNNWLIVARRR